MDIELAISAPAPIPARARKMESWKMSWAIPDSADPIINMIRPMEKNSLRPYMSDSLPNMGRLAAAVTMYPVKTQWKWSSPFRSAAIRGSAALTTVMFKAATIMPIETAT